MATFQYSGRDATGALVNGDMDATSMDDVASALFGDSITPIEIRELDEEEINQAREARRRKLESETDGSFREWLADFLSGSSVGIDELIMFSRQMFSLTKAGLPLDRAIKGLEASLTNPKFRKILNDVINGLESGLTLAAALGRHPKIFSQLFLSLVHVGENTGQLDLAFRQITKYLELEKSTRKQVKSATRYPIFVMVAIGIALAVITVFVIPVFAETFERLAAELPWQTVLLIDISNFVVNYWPIMLIGAAGAVFGFISYTSTDIGLYKWDKLKLSFPLIGVVYERIALGRFARTFSMVMRAGLPVVQGLTVVAGAVGNEFINRNVFGMKDGVERGESLLTTASSSGMFTPLVLQMIAVGEETGTVDDLLEEVADFYDAEVEYDLKRLGDAIEPILIVCIAGLVLILALGVFLPIWDLNTAANN